MHPITASSTALRSVAAVLAAAALLPVLGTSTAHAQKVTAGPPDLTRLYRGSDGSALYTRAVGTKVVGFGEHPTKKSAYVFSGTRNGDQITGTFWDVAKGTRTASGTIKLGVLSGGAKLERQGPRSAIPSSFSAVNASQFTSWPRRREAGFQSTSQTDLDGAFAGGEDARLYARETSQDVVFVGEDWVSESYARPRFVTVFVGKRLSGNVLKGDWFDVPKGTEMKRGAFVGSAGTRPRRISVGQTDVATGLVTGDRTGTFLADYAVDHARFAQEIENRLEPFVVGYGYAIAADGKVVKAGGGGSRELPDPDENDLDAPLPFTADTENEIASTTKTLTAVAVVRELDAKGLTVDTPVAPYLPPGWTLGDGMDTVTFKQLLDHSAGLNHPGSICGDDPYACLQQSVANGLTAAPGYNNIHYTVMRFILPFLANTDYWTQQWASVTDPQERNQMTSQAYEDIIKGMLMPYGIDVDTDYVSSNRAQRYVWGTPPSPVGINDDGESLLGTGSGGFKMTAREYARFLSRFERGWLVKPELVQRMKDDRLGFDDLGKSYRGAGGVGFIYTKNGGTSGTGTQSMIYPGDVQVFISRNSTGNGGLAATSDLLRDAWQAALVD